jgi:hypothetical protein
VAQLVEQRTLNPLVEGSSPSGGTRYSIGLGQLSPEDVAAENDSIVCIRRLSPGLHAIRHSLFFVL